MRRRQDVLGFCHTPCHRGIIVISATGQVGDDRHPVRILCCLNEDVVSNVALNLMLPVLQQHEVSVALSTRIGGASDVAEPQARRELRAAEQLIATQVVFPMIERASFPDNGRFLTFREIAHHRGIPVVFVPDPNAGNGLEHVRRFAPELIVSIRYGAIFKAPLIAIPPKGVLNLHAGLLPAYRGVLASFRAIMAGEPEIGCTLHYVIDGTIDTGPIVAQVRTPVDVRRSLFAHVLSLYPLAVPVVADAIARLGRGERMATRAQTGEAYYSYPSAKEWDQFQQQGWRVADPEDLRELFSRYLPTSA